ncbi:MAG TPA: type II toxin-antitoxin system VapC family toxin [Acidobacteriaceae bacterium]|nr:type II toxin-antitoxin system VapC family toxin [Acidobacteriaceae bacterium]
MTGYLDTHVVVWLANRSLERLTRRARRAVEQHDLLISPMVMLELAYLYERKRITLPARDVLLKLEHEIGLRVCGLPFPQVANAALDELWTRDAFDRVIVAQAKANGLAPLISADEEIQQHYPRTIW